MIENKNVDNLVEKFNNDFETVGTINYSFAEMFNKLLDYKQITKEEFLEEVGLSEETFENYSKGKKDPSLRGLTAFCIAFEIDNNSFLTLLRAGGYSINFKKKRDCAYSFLMTDCMGMTLQECNEILKKIGLEEHDLLPDPTKIER